VPLDRHRIEGVVQHVLVKMVQRRGALPQPLPEFAGIGLDHPVRGGQNAILSEDSATVRNTAPSDDTIAPLAVRSRFPT